MTRNAVIGILIGVMIAAPGWGQNAASRSSSASVQASALVAPAALDLLASGAGFSIAAVRPLGQSVELVLIAIGEGASFTVQLAADATAAAGIAVGAAVTVSAVSGGYLLSAGATAFAFVPSAAVASMIHRRELCQ